jgi:hypothetical protein
MSYIGINELVFNKDEENEIYSGGFSVKSIMMKKGVSPIKTINNSRHNNSDEQTGGDSNQVSDLFDNLVVPNWLLSPPYKLTGGFNNSYNDDEDDDNEVFTDENNVEDDIIDNDLHDKLLELASVPLKNKKKTKRIQMKRNKKITRKNR